MAKAAPERPHPKAIGDASTAMVLARLVQAGKLVLLPFSENQRYDLLIEEPDQFVRVQCKTGRLRNGSIVFNTCSVDYHHPDKGGASDYRHHYRGQADLFGVYCPDLDSVYLVPVDSVGKRACSLRVDMPRNNQVKKVRWAKIYEI
jgi:PD-(D/E)XK endonuclease